MHILEFMISWRFLVQRAFCFQLWAVAECCPTAPNKLQLPDLMGNLFCDSMAVLLWSPPALKGGMHFYSVPLQSCGCPGSSAWRLPFWSRLILSMTDSCTIFSAPWVWLKALQFIIWDYGSGLGPVLLAQTPLDDFGDRLWERFLFMLAPFWFWLRCLYPTSWCVHQSQLGVQNYQALVCRDVPKA